MYVMPFSRLAAWVRWNHARNGGGTVKAACTRSGICRPIQMPAPTVKVNATREASPAKVVSAAASAKSGTLRRSVR